MEEFLKDYVTMIAEARDEELTNQELSIIVHKLQNDEELWDIFDSYVYQKLNDVKGDD